MRLRIYGDGMASIRGFFTGVAATVVGAGLLWGAFGGDPDEIRDTARRSVDGGFAAGEGIAEAVPDNVGRILEERGYDVENMTAEDWADAAADKTIQWGDAGVRFLTTYAERLGFDTQFLELDGQVYRIGDCDGSDPHPRCYDTGGSADPN